MNDLKKIPKFVKKLFYEHDISSLNLGINQTQVKILMIIENFEKERSMVEISKEVGLEKSSFTRSLDHLIDKNYIVKKYSKNDKRIVNLSFTAKGRKNIKLINDDWDKYIKELTSVLNKEEKIEFKSTIKTLSKYINKIIN